MVPLAIDISQMTTRRRELAFLRRLRRHEVERYAGARAHVRERPHVAERLGENVARARQPGFLAARDRRPAEADRDAMAVRPIGDLARRDDGASAVLARDLDRNFEIDLLAPGQH